MFHMKFKQNLNYCATRPLVIILTTTITRNAHRSNGRQKFVAKRPDQRRSQYHYPEFIMNHYPEFIMNHYPQTFVCLPMSRGYELPETLCAQIVILKQRGDSWAWIGSFLGIHPETTRRVYMRWKETRYFSSTLRSNCPKFLNVRDVRYIARHITFNRDTRKQALGKICNVSRTCL